jgi:5-oxoprolinase (ATP-hydrolysing) subunit A
VRTIDLNADVGEGMDDTALMPLLSSANIACGGHAGDDDSLRRTIQLALQYGVQPGAHPSYEDRENFGRLAVDVAPSVLEGQVAKQVERAWRAAREAGARLAHVKPHGALYHRAAESLEVAMAVALGAQRVDPTLVLVGSPGGLLLRAGAELGMSVAAEGFADRRYLADGRLVPRSRADALITDPEEAAAQALSMVKERWVRAVDGAQVALSVQTLCIHGDTPSAPAIARRLRERFGVEGIEVRALGRR